MELLDQFLRTLPPPYDPQPSTSAVSEPQPSTSVEPPTQSSVDLQPLLSTSVVPDDPQSSSGDESDPQPPTGESKPASDDDVDESINGRVAVKQYIDSSPVKDCSVVFVPAHGTCVTKCDPRSIS